VVESIVYTPGYILRGVDFKGRIVYQSMEVGVNSLGVFDEDVGEKKRLTSSVVHWSGEVSGDGRRTPFTVDVAKGRELQVVGFVDLDKDKEFIYSNMNPVRVLGIADYDGKMFFVGASAEDIAIYIAEGGDNVEKLVKLNAIARISYAFKGLVVGEGNLRRDPRSSEIFTYNLGSGELKVYTPKEGSVNRNPIVLSNGKILFETNAVTGDTNNLMLLDPETGEFTELKLLVKDLENFKPVEYPFYREFDGRIVVVGKKYGRSRIFIDGKLVETPEGTIANVYVANNKIYYTYTNLTKPARIMVFENRSNRELLGGKLPKDIEDSFSSIEFTWVKSPDGLDIPVYVVKSRKNNEKNVFVVYIHGGPWSEVADAWTPMISVLIAMGYNVVAPNFRGSTGYGERFRLMDIGDPGGGDLLDVEATTKWGFENKLGEKAFIWGYSYGGYMTLWAMFNKPELYSCGVAGAPVADWEEMYELSDAMFREFIKMLFDNKKELWKERSPSTKASHLRAPLAIIQPQNDSRTPLKPVLNLVYKLIEHGKTFQLHVVSGIGHAITSLDKLAEVLTYMLSFIEQCTEG